MWGQPLRLSEGWLVWHGDVMPPDPLNLPAFRVLSVETSEHDYHIDAESITFSKECPHCHSANRVEFGNQCLHRESEQPYPGDESAWPRLPVIRAAFVPSMKFIQRRAGLMAGPASLARGRRLAIAISRIGDVLRSRAAKERL